MPRIRRDHREAALQAGAGNEPVLRPTAGATTPSLPPPP